MSTARALLGEAAEDRVRDPVTFLLALEHLARELRRIRNGRERVPEQRDTPVGVGARPLEPDQGRSLPAHVLGGEVARPQEAKLGRREARSFRRRQRGSALDLRTSHAGLMQGEEADRQREYDHGLTPTR